MNSFCQRCGTFSVLPYHCDNCGDRLSSTVTRADIKRQKSGVRLAFLLFTVLLFGVAMGYAIGIATGRVPRFW